MDSFPRTRAAQRIKQWRRQHGLNQEAASARLGVTRSWLARWETGAAMPAKGMVQRLKADGVCEPNDWYEPALEPVQCAYCERSVDDLAIARCDASDCPLAGSDRRSLAA